ncbi:type VII secretion protein EccE [Gordonia malaquae]|uniref:type VII secretion protein EccE n=1 Tax=Gordonia malaquae TaxID=410332 RepID=UPI0030FF387E
MRRIIGSTRGCPHTFEPFDVPNGDGYTGLRRDGPGLVCVLALIPGPPAPVSLPDGPRVRVPVETIATCMARSDARPTHVDVVTRTLMWWGDGPATRAYRGLLGPLVPASHRTVALVVHVDPAQHPHAVALRGGGNVGALRTVLWCVRRVRAACASAGVQTRPLTAAELSTDGAWTTADDTDAVARILPGGVDGVAPPLAGDGQLIGADDDGTPIALRVAGPSIPRVSVDADLPTVRQTVVRALALGVRAHVVSDRSEQWTPLVDMIGDSLLLSYGPTVPPTSQIVVDDTTDRSHEHAGLTVIDVGHHRDPGCYLLRQEPDDSSTLHLIDPGGGRRTVRTVTTPAERALTG